MRRILLPLLLLCAAGAVFSLDFGLLMDHEIEATNDLFYYSPSFTPWFSWDGGGNISVYASGIIFFEYKDYYNAGESGWAKPEFRFDLARTAVNWNISDTMSLELGRVRYDDALGFAAAGLFDGAGFQMFLPQGTINAGVFFTGLLYKETALILMTANDDSRYNEAWDKNFDYYFASSRLLTAARWDMPLFGDANTLSAEVLAQFDLNGKDDDCLHSQYVEVKYEFYPVKNIGLTAGLLLEMMENDSAAAAAFGFLAGMGAEVPGALNDWFDVYIKFTSGSTDKTFPAFMPITSVSQGEVFQEPLSGLMLISGDYNLRINETMYTEAFLRYYIRTYPSTEGNAYGGEIWGSFAWQPFDDIRLTVGGGVFLPGLGDVYKDTDPMWKVNAIFSMSF